MNSAGRKPDWGRLAPLLAPAIGSLTPGLVLPTYTDDLVYSDFSEVSDTSQLQAVISALQQSCEVLLTAKRRAAEQLTRVTRANEEIAAENERLRSQPVPSMPESHRCEECGKKFKSQAYLVRHVLRRHAPDQSQPSSPLAISTTQLIPSTLQPSPPSNLAPEISARVVEALVEQQREGREWLALELQAAVRRALELQALLPPGESWTGDLDLSGGSFLTPSPRG